MTHIPDLERRLEAKLAQYETRLSDLERTRSTTVVSPALPTGEALDGTRHYDPTTNTWSVYSGDEWVVAGLDRYSASAAAQGDITINTEAWVDLGGPEVTVTVPAEDSFVWVLLDADARNYQGADGHDRGRAQAGLYTTDIASIVPVLLNERVFNAYDFVWRRLTASPSGLRRCTGVITTSAMAHRGLGALRSVGHRAACASYPCSLPIRTRYRLLAKVSSDSAFASFRERRLRVLVI